MESVLGITAVHDGDCIIFDDLAIRFGSDGRVKSVFRTIDGSGSDGARANPGDSDG